MECGSRLQQLENAVGWKFGLLILAALDVVVAIPMTRVLHQH